MKILLASRNPGKIKEFGELLPWAHLVQWPAEAPEIPEEGAFFQDNALQKACFARDWWALDGRESVAAILADDSGLCVDAMWGGPGVLSARFAPRLSWPDRYERLLSMMPLKASRNARFVCVLAFVPVPDGRSLFVEGVVEGEVAEAARGNNGFGFDPIFVPRGAERTFAEMSSAEKHGMSHRARACAALTSALKES